MRYYFSPAVALAIISVGTAAFASQHVSGKIVSMDRPALTLKLSDGNAYHLSNNQQFEDMKPGEKVWITWDQKGEMRMVKSVEPYVRLYD